MPETLLLLDDEDRYARLRLIRWWDQARLARSNVLVVGAGALGNEVLKNLAMVGVGRLTVVDFEQIEAANLTRSVLFRRRDQGRAKAEVAAEALADLNPEIQVRPIVGNVLTDVGLGLFRDADVVIGCLDNREARLWVNRCCWQVGTPWVDGGIQEIDGVVKTFTPPEGACYECAMTENDYRLINLRYSCPLLRQEDLLAGKVPTAPTIASMIGGLQAQEALKLIHGLPVGHGEALVYNGVANRFYRTRFQVREDCLSHDRYPEAVELPLCADRQTAGELLAAAQPHLDAGDLQLVLERDLVVSIACRACGTEQPILRPLPLVGLQRGICPRCGELGRPQLVHQIPAGSSLAGHTLRELGIPPYDMVRVANADQERVFLLAGDRDALRV
jgi:adenylyltransferase/sulfurtransferase